MPIRIVPYTSALVPVVQAFNQRLDAGQLETFRVPEAPPPASDLAESGVDVRHFLAVDDDGEVRGSYCIHTRPVWIRGQVRMVGHFTAPLSEGILNPRYGSLGALLIAHAVKQQPLLFAMGMGGFDRPLPRILKGMGWHVLAVPFWFRVFRGRRFLRQIGPFRRTLPRRLLVDALAFSGIGPAAIAVAQRLRTQVIHDIGIRWERIAEIEPWMETVWNRNREEYSLGAERSVAYLRNLYPSLAAPFHAFKLHREGAFVGWFTLLSCKPLRQKYFGALEVMALVDGVAPAKFLPHLIQAAVHEAERQGADLLISNQAHRSWNHDLRAAGFWAGPSNYLLALSKELARSLEPLSETVPLFHFNRGDGDGMINLT